MSSDDGVIFKPYKFERVCEPIHPNISQLVLKDVDTTESVYTRTLIHLRDASLPQAVDYGGVTQKGTQTSQIIGSVETAGERAASEVSGAVPQRAIDIGAGGAGDHDKDKPTL